MKCMRQIEAVLGVRDTTAAVTGAYLLITEKGKMEGRKDGFIPLTSFSLPRTLQLRPIIPYPCARSGQPASPELHLPHVHF